jgi:hypothetical protein
MWALIPQPMNNARDGWSGRWGFTRGEVASLIPTRLVVCEFYAKNAVTCDFNGDGREGPHLINFLLFLKSSFCFLKRICNGGLLHQPPVEI